MSFNDVDMMVLVKVIWSLGFGALTLGLAVIPFAYRRVQRSIWILHGITAITIGLTAGVIMHAAIFSVLVPAWHTVLGYVAGFGLPPVVAGSVARAADRRWSQTGRWRIAVAALGTYVLAVYVGWRLFALLVPEVVNAVK